MAKEERSLYDYEIGEYRGDVAGGKAYKLKWLSKNKDFQVWENSNGRFLVLDARSDVPVRFNIRDQESAITLARERAGELDPVEEKMLHRPPTVVRRIGEVVPKFDAMYVGGSKDYGVWKLGKGTNFQIASRSPERGISSALSEKRFQQTLPIYSPNIAYQQSFGAYSEEGPGSLPLESTDWGKLAHDESFGGYNDEEWGPTVEKLHVKKKKHLSERSK